MRLARITTVGPTGPHLTRYFMYQQVAQLMEHTTHGTDPGLAIGDSRQFFGAIGVTPHTLVEANYPEETMLALAHPTDTFDFVVSDQVLEHVEGNPAAAIAESLRVAKPGGIVIHTTCFLNPIHWGPKDLWRFTPDGLVHLAGPDVDVLQAAGWGNHAAATAVRLDLRMLPVPHARWHPIHRLATRNDPLRPILTWIVMRKNDGGPAPDDEA